MTRCILTKTGPRTGPSDSRNESVLILNCVRLYLFVAAILQVQLFCYSRRTIIVYPVILYFQQTSICKTIFYNKVS